MANFKIAPRAAFLQYNELNFGNLYLHHYYNGPNPAQATIINGVSGQLGWTNVNNWPIYDGLGSDAKVVARGQGLHIYAGNWRCSLSIVFENERFKGSTLEVDGILVDQGGEWAIVGGTGEFKMASGVIYKKMREHNSNGDIIQLTVHGFCPVLLKHYRVGPWGADTAGQPYDLKVTPLRLVESITVRHGGVVDAIEFTYTDQVGEKHKEKMGGNGGDASTFNLRPTEYVIEVSGTIGSYGEACISTIKFVTNMGATHGPFGDGKNATGSYNAVAEDGYSIAGFFGRSGKYVNKLGFHMSPL